MGRRLRRIVPVIAAVFVVGVVAFLGVYFPRLRTVGSIQRLTDYGDGWDLYRMVVKYDYRLDAVIDHGITDDQSMVDAIIKASLPLLPVHIDVPDFGCTAFLMTDSDGTVRMGRNYDFRRDTSAMLVYCAPKEGYRSVGFAALDNVSASQPLTTAAKRLACLTAPFICLDGMNEKGVSIAVLTLDSAPTVQHTGKPVIATTLAIRLVLDNAATTQEAVALLQGYDMYASGGRDYHFYIADADGDGCVVEYDCDDPARPMVVTETPVVTNYFACYADRVRPDQHNGVYGHGKERADAVRRCMLSGLSLTEDVAWIALRTAAQEPDPASVTSNTQWSILYNDTDLTVQVALRRHWDDVFQYDLLSDSFTQ